MGEVLALGVTHYPPLMGPDADMAWVLEWTLDDPDLPPSLTAPEGWPKAMRAEYGSDRGTTSARAHRTALLDGFTRVRRALDDFDPDVVVIWGDDQYENFREDVIPPFTILAYDAVEASPWLSGTRRNVWDEPRDAVFKIQGAPDFGRQLAGALIERDIDMAYSYAPLHHPSLPHSFLNAVLLLDYDRHGFPYPVLPVAVNCYGSRVISYKGGRSRLAERERPLDPPGPNPSRCMAVGAAIADAALASSSRIALVASSSWSHAFLTDHTYRLHPDFAADRTLYDALTAGDFRTWRDYTTAQLEHAGQQEVLNWFCLAGAVERLGVLPSWTALVETHVFNSNKVFAVYPAVSP
jgi:hypothetical protein